MENEYLVQRLKGIHAALMAQHIGGSAMPSDARGSEREAFLREFLAKVFPSHYRFTSGAITDAAGNCSGQLDIVVEYPFLPSFPMPGTIDRLLLAESAAMVIEIKSNLVNQWNEVEASAKKVRALERRLNTLMSIGQMPGPRIPYVAVGYAGHKTSENLEKRLMSTDEASRPDSALVVDSGAFVWAPAGLKNVSGRPEAGLFGLCVMVYAEVRTLVLAQPNPFEYFS